MGDMVFFAILTAINIRIIWGVIRGKKEEKHNGLASS
jgi:hypothetical protein